MKTMRPPKSPTINNYVLPCQIPVKGVISKEISFGNLPLSVSRSLNRNNSSSSTRKSQSTLEMQLDLLKKIQIRKK